MAEARMDRCTVQLLSGYGEVVQLPTLSLELGSEEARVVALATPELVLSLQRAFAASGRVRLRVQWLGCEVEGQLATWNVYVEAGGSGRVELTILIARGRRVEELEVTTLGDLGRSYLSREVEEVAPAPSPPARRRGSALEVEEPRERVIRLGTSDTSWGEGAA